MRRVVSIVLLAGCAGVPAASVVAPSEPPPKAPVAPFTRTPPPAALAVAPMASVERSNFILKNGLRVVVLPRSGSPLVGARLVFDGGGAEDAPQTSGVTYLSVALLGELYETDASGKRLVSEKPLRAQISKLGGQYRWGVTHDASMIGVDGYAKDLEAYLGKLAGAVVKPRAGERGFSHYRHSAMDHLEDLEVSDDEIFGIVVSQLAFGGDHVYGRSVHGDLGSLKRLTLEDVVARQKALIHPSRATLLIVGGVEAEAAAVLAARALETWAPKATPGKRIVIDRPAPARRSSVKLVPKTPATTTRICATRALGEVAPDDASPEVLAHVLGGGLNARLSVLREKHGWSYSPGAHVAERRAARSLVLCARVDAKATSEALGVFMATLETLRQGTVSEAELALAKGELGAQARARGGDHAGALALMLERLLLAKTPESRVAEIARVDARSVSALAQKALDPALLQIIVLGQPGWAQHAIKAQGLGPVEEIRLADLGRR